MGGLKGVVQSEKAITVLVAVSKLVKAAVEKKAGTVIDGALDLMALIKSGIDIHELQAELAELDQDDQKKLLEFLNVEVKGLKMPEIEAKVKECSELIVDGYVVYLVGSAYLKRFRTFLGV